MSTYSGSQFNWASQCISYSSLHIVPCCLVFMPSSVTSNSLWTSYVKAPSIQSHLSGLMVFFFCGEYALLLTNYDCVINLLVKWYTVMKAIHRLFLTCRHSKTLAKLQLSLRWPSTASGSPSPAVMSSLLKKVSKIIYVYIFCIPRQWGQPFLKLIQYMNYKLYAILSQCPCPSLGLALYKFF